MEISAACNNTKCESYRSCPKELKINNGNGKGQRQRCLINSKASFRARWDGRKLKKVGVWRNQH